MDKPRPEPYRIVTRSRGKPVTPPRRDDPVKKATFRRHAKIPANWPSEAKVVTTIQSNHSPEAVTVDLVCEHSAGVYVDVGSSVQAASQDSLVVMVDLKQRLTQAYIQFQHIAYGLQINGRWVPYA